MINICPCALLLSVMEKFTENTRFCLICNYLTKIIPALQSRCTRFRFGPLENEQMTSRLQHVISAEGLVCRNAMAELFTLPPEGLAKKIFKNLTCKLQWQTSLILSCYCFYWKYIVFKMTFLCTFLGYKFLRME